MTEHSRVGPIVAILALSCVLGCADGRPAAREITIAFTNRHPDWVVGRVRITEDEVVARSAEIEFRAPLNRKSHGRAQVHFVRDENGSWQMVSESVTMTEGRIANKPIETATE